MNEQVRHNLRFLDFSDTRHVGCVRPQTANSEEHEDLKFKKAYHLAKIEHPFVCEARLKDHSMKFDLIDLYEGIDYELTSNMNIKHIKKMKEKYLDCPFIVKIVDVKTNTTHELEEILKEEKNG